MGAGGFGVVFPVRSLALQWDVQLSCISLTIFPSVFQPFLKCKVEERETWGFYGHLKFTRREAPSEDTSVAVGTREIHWKCLLLGWLPSPCPAPDIQHFPNLRRIEELLPGASTLVNTSSFASLAAGGIGPSACGTCGNSDRR